MPQLPAEPLTVSRWPKPQRCSCSSPDRKKSSHVKTSLPLHMQKAIMLKTQTEREREPCEVQIKSQRHGRQEKRPIKFAALFPA